MSRAVPGRMFVVYTSTLANLVRSITSRDYVTARELLSQLEKLQTMVLGPVPKRVPSVTAVDLGVETPRKRTGTKTKRAARAVGR